jgi:uncharacterized phage protein gp47/JayE
MNFSKEFDELWNEILTDYRNQFEGKADTSEGSLVFIKSACLASAVWGLHKHQDYIADQIFPDTADEENLEHHSWVRDITRKVGESVSGLLDRVLDNIRRPPAGGNKYDYVKWAKKITNVKKAYSFPLAQGLGSVDVVIIADAVATGSEIPDQALLDEVKAYIEDVMSVEVRFLRVLPPTVVNQDVTMTVTGSANLAQITADVTAYINNMTPGQVLYVKQLDSIAIANGADDVDVTVPAETVTPQPTEMLRAGAIDVS